MMEALLRNLHPGTRLCLAVNLTGPDEWIRTQTVAEWKKQLPEFHKQPAIFLFLAT
jgi:16S rRNA (cytidine1402-2'-O)-methyltransferase